MNETKRLKDIIQKNINIYYMKYNPNVYDRGNHGGNLRNSLSVDECCKISSTGMTMTIKVNDNAIHNSIFNKSKANAFWLLNDGWKVKKNVWFKDIYRFGHYGGAHFIEDAVEEFERTDRYGIKVEVIRPLMYF